MKGKLPSKTEKETNKDIQKEVRKRDCAKRRQWKAYIPIRDGTLATVESKLVIM